MNTQDISDQVKKFILTKLLPENTEPIDNSTPLISTGVIDSIAALQLVSFLEDTFDIGIKPREVGIDHMDTVECITELVLKKRSA